MSWKLHIDIKNRNDRNASHDKPFNARDKNIYEACQIRILYQYPYITNWDGNYVILIKFDHWQHRKLSKSLSVRPMMKISSKWRHFRLNAKLLHLLRRSYTGMSKACYAVHIFTIYPSKTLNWHQAECKMYMNMIRVWSPWYQITVLPWRSHQ